ncbi:hypothetical protein [Thermincola potens]|uniref:Uncharacterized protein n=1 Tax=Thermincola potens (strain JR) TaxID=635013 RepID=D5XDF4_THEPJ|nr:hypothetical protein [Thermincola potens]ADG81802.1 hypothetical protein TherJR_0936 [Thermincola potens JR]
MLSNEQFIMIMQAIKELAGDVKTLDQRLTETENRLRSEIGSVRTELKAEIESVRSELKAEIQDLREQNSREHEQIRAEIVALAEMYGRHEIEITKLKKAQ